MEKRLLSITEAAEYIGLGKTKAREVLKEMGAIKRYGRRVLYDIYIIDKNLEGQGR